MSATLGTLVLMIGLRELALALSNAAGQHDTLLSALLVGVGTLAVVALVETLRNWHAVCRHSGYASQN